MHEYVIEGGYPIHGTVTASGNKNAALPCIAATLLTDEPVILHNIPEIQDTNVMFEILKSLGAKVEKISKHNWKIQCDKITRTALPTELTKKVRGSIVFAGSLLASKGKCEMTPPGGDVIGRRRLDTHFLALKALGANILRLDTFNWQGRDFYIKCGYEEVGRYESPEDGFSEHFFIKRIGDAEKKV